MSEKYFVVMDSETGGLSCKDADVLTLFMSIATEDLQVIDELDLKLKPDGRLPIADAGALAVNKIDLHKHLEDPNTITYSEAKVKITAFLKKYLKKRGKYSNLILLGQNVSFDLKFIWEYILTEQEWDSMVSYNVEDTKTACLFLKRCGWIPQELGTLGSMVEYFNIPRHTAHEARGDVLMTIEVYKALINLMKSKKDGGSSQDLISLLEAE